MRRRLEPAVGADLSGLRVHTGAAAQVAAASVGARAFTLGSSVVIGEGESSEGCRADGPRGDTHVAQQASGVSRLGLMRQEDDDGLDVAAEDSLIPDWIMDGVRSSVRSLPGYTVVTAAVGHDLITGEPVSGGPTQLIEDVLTEGPFGAGVAAALRGLELVEQVVSLVTSALAEHHLTLARIQADLSAAWDEFSAANLIDGNVAIARRYVTAMLTDLRACVDDLVQTIMTRVRELVVDLVEPYLTEGPLASVWGLARKVMHHDPLRGLDVDVPTAEILADFLRLIGQDALLGRMSEEGNPGHDRGVAGPAVRDVRDPGSDRAVTLFVDAWAAISPGNLPTLLDTLPGLAARAVGLFDSVTTFAAAVLGQVVALIKDALLAKISERAQGMRGYRLLTVIIGQDPFTGHDVDRSAANLIGGFITLLPGGEATFAQLSESGVIAEAAARIESEMTRLDISRELITGTFRAIWDGLHAEDVLDPIGTILRVLDQFGEPLGRIVSFAATVVQVVIELVLRLMNFPSELLGTIVATLGQAIDDIKNDPMAFLDNLLAALKSGFMLFFDNIGSHLLHGLADWLFRGLHGIGVTVPTDLSGEAVLDTVLQVLGLSVDFLWERLALQIGPNRVTMIRGAVGPSRSGLGLCRRRAGTRDRRDLGLRLQPARQPVGDHPHRRRGLVDDHGDRSRGGQGAVHARPHRGDGGGQQLHRLLPRGPVGDRLHHRDPADRQHLRPDHRRDRARRHRTRGGDAGERPRPGGTGGDRVPGQPSGLGQRSGEDHPRSSRASVAWSSRRSTG